MDSPPPPPLAPWPARRAARWLIPIAVVSAVSGAIAGLSYRSYAEEFLRPGRAPRCAVTARAYLSEPALVSGTEPHDLPNGETAYLTPPEDAAVRCANSISSDLGAHLTAAFTEQQPELRALELLKVVRDHVPRDKDHDREAATGFFIASAAMKALPDLPEKKAALEELELLHGCRFGTRLPCPTRPPIPPIVWIGGAIAAVGVLVLGEAGVAGVIRLIRGALRRRAARRARPAR